MPAPRGDVFAGASQLSVMLQKYAWPTSRVGMLNFSHFNLTLHGVLNRSLGMRFPSVCNELPSLLLIVLQEVS
jgi:hypothetical protein